MAKRAKIRVIVAVKKRVRAQLFASRRRVFARHWALHSALLSRAVSRVDARGMQPRLAEDARGCARFAEPRAPRSCNGHRVRCTRARARAPLHARFCTNDSANHGRTTDTTLTRLHVGASHLGAGLAWPETRRS